MKFGAFDQNDVSGLPLPEHYARRLELAELYDRLGFHIYHMSEHHCTPLSLTPSPSVFLAALSQRTKRLRFGPLVYLLPLYNPLRLAEEICMLDGLSDGRFEFGIGRGASPHEVRFMGVVPDQAAEVYQEVYDTLVQGLTKQRLDYQGKHWRFDGVPLAMRPVQRPHPPIWYAASSAESAKWPARQGVNVIASGPLQRIKAVAAAYRAEYASVGRPMESLPLIGLNRYVVVADSDTEALAIARSAWTAFYASFWKLWGEFGGKPATAVLPATIAPLLESGGAIVGAPARVRAILAEQLRETGVTYFSGSFVFGTMPFDAARHSIELFAREVMPALANIDRDPAVLAAAG